MKMIIYIDETNWFHLKLVICAKLANKPYEIKNVKSQELNLELPARTVLKVNDDISFFSSNAACLYLLSCNVDSSENSLRRAELLEWEHIVLSPLVVKSFNTASISSNISTCLNELNNILLKTKYIQGETLSVVDVCIWSSLYPILYNTKDKNALRFLPNLLKWYNEMEKLDNVQNAIKEYRINLPGSTKYTFKSLTEDNNTCNIKKTENIILSESPVGTSPEIKPEITVEELDFAKEAWINGHKLLEKPLPDEKIILPKDGHKNILITSALPYVNNVPHLGNIIGCVLSADVFARYCRLCNYNTLFISGTDEYGTATETKALEEGTTPRQICDKYFEIHNGVYRWFGIGFDYFGRTTTPEQTEIAQNMFLNLYKNGFVETQTVEQLLCEKCNRFLADRFVEGICPHPGCGYEDARGDQCDNCSKLINATDLKNPRCKLCSHPPVLRSSSHFFIDLPQLEPLLQNWVSSNESNWTNNAQQITRSWLKAGLKPRCITRDLQWGVPVPVDGFRDKVFYVWFDAPIGYISITKRYTDQYEKWWRPDPKHKVTLYQFMAKDNVPFHSVIFPSTLLGVGQKHVMVKHIMATEYLNYEDGKFSKSRGVGVFGNDAQETGIPADVFRFYLLSIRPEGQDSSFSWIDLATRNNSELLNNLGNFVNRSIVFCANSFNGIMPAVELDNTDMNLLALINRELKGYVESMEISKQRDGLKHILNISRLGNQLMQSQQPWVLLKGTDDAKARAGTVIALSCNISCLLGILLNPFMPQTSRTLLKQLNTTIDAVGRINPKYPSFNLLLPAGHKIGKPSPLFSKIETATVEELRKKYGGRQSNSPAKETKLVKLTVEELELKIQEQGEKVRKSKSSGADKSVWSPMVEVLLSLKTQLANTLTAEGKASGAVIETKSKSKKGSKKK